MFSQHAISIIRINILYLEITATLTSSKLRAVIYVGFNLLIPFKQMINTGFQLFACSDNSLIQPNHLDISINAKNISFHMIDNIR